MSDTGTTIGVYDYDTLYQRIPFPVGVLGRGTKFVVAKLTGKWSMCRPIRPERVGSNDGGVQDTHSQGSKRKMCHHRVEILKTLTHKTTTFKHFSDNIRVCNTIFTFYHI